MAMCLVCAAGAGDIGTGVSNILATVTAFSPVIGIFAYRIYRATAISSYAKKDKWIWWTGGLLAVYSAAIYIILGLISYGVAPYSINAATIILYLTLILLPVFWLWFGGRVLKAREKIRRTEIVGLSLLGAIPYLLTVILFVYITLTPTYIIQAQENVHYLNVLYGIGIPIILFISSINLFVICMEYIQRKRAKNIA